MWLFKSTGVLLFVIFMFLLSGCSQSDAPKSVSKKFWDAVQALDMETAKQMATWDTVEYLKYLKSTKFHPERFELGEVMLGEARAEVVTILYTQELGKSGVKVPGLTVLVKTEKGWRVDVKKTLNSVVKHTINNVFDQLNGLMQKGLQDLDKSLSNSLGGIGRALEQGAEELKQELSQPLFAPNESVPKVINKPRGK